MPREGKDSQYHQRLCRVETNYFSFGGFDWSLMLYPNGDSRDDAGQSMVGLVRQTNFDHVCRVRYRLQLGQGNRIVDSEMMEQTVDIAGRGELYNPGYNLYHLCSSKSKLRIQMELMSVTALSEVQICPLDRSKNRGHLYDRDKQAWIIESDVSRYNLKLRLFYADIRNVPRMCLRHVMFGVSVLPLRGGHQARPIRAKGSPFYEYYSQNDPDDCFDVCTDITVESLQDADSVYLDPEFHRMTIQVEWLETHVLHHERYQRLDDINSKHKHQMLREIMALQAENYALEKQLYSYQVSIAKTETPRPKDEPEPEVRDGYRRLENDRGPHRGQNCRR
ncbi:hypothetical protein LSH36_1042g00007 [Paralvinella palmiformis]|uniref:MATH domain-containing protein n=1 Tax=Paralvinella palmiformis TaxID=53620 RepID=A0AAD9IVR1_9ANNE|nr:hypothetical protein LSH36_1042g00007 [Paralvinella palmiformis]